MKQGEHSNQGRDFYWDNLRFVLIGLVVIGHFISPMKVHSDQMYTIGNWIYLFHMPAFLFVSGAFAKSAYSRKNGFQVSTATFYLILYILFYTAIFLYASLLGLTPKFNPFIASNSTWYFLSLSTLILLVPAVTSIKRPTVMTAVSILFSLVVGFSQQFDTFLSLSRTIVFAPFFFAGLYLDTKKFSTFIEKARRWVWPIVLASAFLIATILIVWFLPKNIVSALAMIIMPYTNISFLPETTSMILRLIWYVIAALLVFALCFLIPTKKTAVSSLGSRTLQVYIAHPFIHFALSSFDIYAVFLNPLLPLSGYIMILISIITTILLALPKWPDRALRLFSKRIKKATQKEWSH